jgi:hypothetical protein
MRPLPTILADVSQDELPDIGLARVHAPSLLSTRPTDRRILAPALSFAGIAKGRSPTQPVCSALRGVFLELYSMKSILVFGRPI